jgi:hypothetical protein
MKSISKLYCKNLWTSIVTVILIIAAMVPLIAQAEINTTGTYFWISPTGNINQANGQNFTISINIQNAPATYAWNLILAFDNNTVHVVQATEGSWLSSVNTNTTFIKTAYATANKQGWTALGCSFYGNVVGGASGSGTLCTVKFNVLAAGKTSALDLQSTSLLSMNLVRTEYPNNDGFFAETTATVHDIEITSVVSNVSSPVNQGAKVKFTVTIHNGGTSAESGSVTVTANPNDTREPVVAIDGAQAFGPLAIGASTTVNVNWTTTAVAGQYYNIVSNASIGRTDDDPHDNMYIGPAFRVKCPDNIKIANVAPVNPLVHIAKTANVSVTVYNEGQNSETFDVKVYANSTNVATVHVAALAVNETRTVYGTWTPLVAGTLAIKANATLAPTPEKDTADNQMTGGTLLVVNDDIAVLSITAPLQPGAVTNVGFNVTVTVKNVGTDFARCNVYVWAVWVNQTGQFNQSRWPPTPNAGMIGWIQGVSLAPNETLTFKSIDPYTGMPCGDKTHTLWPPSPLPAGTPLKSGTLYYLYAVAVKLQNATDDNPSNNFASIASPVKATVPGDVDGSGKVIWVDLTKLGAAYGKDTTDPKWSSTYVHCDTDGSGKVNWVDLSNLGGNYGKSA